MRICFFEVYSEFVSKPTKWTLCPFVSRCYLIIRFSLVTVSAELHPFLLQEPSPGGPGWACWRRLSSAWRWAPRWELIYGSEFYRLINHRCCLCSWARVQQSSYTNTCNLHTLQEARWFTLQFFAGQQTMLIVLQPHIGSLHNFLFL